MKEDRLPVKLREEENSRLIESDQAVWSKFPETKYSVHTGVLGPAYHISLTYRVCLMYIPDSAIDCPQK